MAESRNQDCCGCGPPSAAAGAPAAQGDTLSGGETSVFRVLGMDCGDEIAAIQKALSHPKVFGVNASLMASTVTVAHDPSLQVEELRKMIESAGVRVASADRQAGAPVDRRRVALVALSGLFAALGFVLEGFFHLPSVALAVDALAVLSGGVLVFPKALRAARQLQLDMNVLMSVAVVGAFGIGDHSEAATVVFLFSLSELLEAFSVARARKAIREVMDLAPKMATRISTNGSLDVVSVKAVGVGDLLLVKAGESIPSDGVVEEGASLVNQAPLTGESVPVAKEPGTTVFSGTVNETSVLKVRVSAAFEDSKVSHVVRMIEEAQKQKAPSERFVDSFARYYTPAVFLAALLTFLVPPLALGGAWNDWLYRALVLLVVACPCALVLSTPVSIVSGLTAMARRGVLVKGGAFLEALGQVRAIAIDKTGTITEGKPRVLKVEQLNGYTEREILEAAASVEQLSSHPLAEAVVRHAKEQGIMLKSATQFRNQVGRGAEATIEGHEYFLGNHRFAHELGVCTPELEDRLSRMEQQALSVIVVGHRPHTGCQGEVLGVLALGDPIRDTAPAAIRSLREAGIQRLIMLSGDNQKTAAAIADKVGLDEAMGDLLPEDKVREIKNLVSKHRKVAMIGDGINDAPALAQATVGIAMGAAGTDTALETADVALMRDDLGQVAVTVRQGRRALSVIRFNIGLALVVKAVFLMLAFAGYSNLWLAVAADTGTSLLVIGNALRLLRI